MSESTYDILWPEDSRSPETLLLQSESRISALEAALIAADESVSSCDEILRLMIENIESNGHYSVGSTVTFLQGARSELTAYRQARDATR